MKWRRRRLARFRATKCDWDARLAKAAAFEAERACWLPLLQSYGDGPTPCVGVRASTRVTCTIDEQSDFALSVLMDGGEIASRGKGAPLLITEKIRKRAAEEWLRRYPEGVKHSKRWAPSLDWVQRLAAA